MIVLQALASGEVLAPEDGAAYVEHSATALAHFVPGIGFMVLGGLQFSRRLRLRWPRWHRWSGRVFFALALSVALSGLWMNEHHAPIGGTLKYVGAAFFGLAMVSSLVVGVVAIRQGHVELHRRWMARAFAIGLAFGVQRLIFIPAFLVLGEVSELMIGVVMWSGWLITLAACEFALRRTARGVVERAATSAPSPAPSNAPRLSGPGPSSPTG